MSETQQETTVLALPCPNCGEDTLKKGFYNYCSETVALREDNFSAVSNGRVFVDHDENDHETVDHECQGEAYCRSCETQLPWTTFDIRDLDGLSPGDAQKAVAELIEQAQK